MGVEYELKFGATEVLQSRIRRELGGKWMPYTMETTYYDTPQLTLAARRWTLRRRLENGVCVCALKTPAGEARGEWEVRCEAIEDGIGELCKLGAPKELLELTAGGVVPVCGARFTRHAATFMLPDGAVEVALDAGVLFAGQRQEPLCEVEVELKSGQPITTQVFAGRLALDYGLKPEPKSKFKRALALMR